jgi:hypothetical protein
VCREVDFAQSSEESRQESNAIRVLLDELFYCVIGHALFRSASSLDVITFVMSSSGKSPRVEISHRQGMQSGQRGLPPVAITPSARRPTSVL